MEWAVAFLVTAATMPAVIRLAPLVGAMDVPGEWRRVHTRATPRMGGVGIAAGLLAASFASDSLPLGILAAGCAAVAALGLTDDVFSLPPWGKLAGQVLAASVLPFAGFVPRAITLGGWRAPLSPEGGAVFAVFLTVLLMNAVNFTDGLDGLAAGCVLPGACLLGGESGFALAGAALGFLLFNLPPARLFLGDCGSLLLGYGMGALLLIRGTGGAFSLGWLLFAAVPVADLLFAVVRRTLHGQSPFAADRGHIHHRLLARGASPLRATVCLWLASALCATLAALFA